MVLVNCLATVWTAMQGTPDALVAELLHVNNISPLRSKGDYLRAVDTLHSSHLR
jgi:hypothetical protein